MNYPQAPFEITYKVGATPYTFEVQPSPLIPESFLISLDSEDVGVVKRNRYGTWQWNSGGLEGLFIEGEVIAVNSAAEIGVLIEGHYNT